MRTFAGTLILSTFLQVGRLGDLHFAISRKMLGQTLALLSRYQEVYDLLPQILDILAAIHGIDVSDTQGYGCFTDQGRGYFPSWSDHLHMIAREEADNDYFGKWYPLFDETFLTARSLSGSLPADVRSSRVLSRRSLSDLWRLELLRHAMLAQDGKITALLNWVDASYGDVVYDIAVLDFWWPWLGMHNAFQKDFVAAAWARASLLRGTFALL